MGDKKFNFVKLTEENYTLLTLGETFTMRSTELLGLVDETEEKLNQVTKRTTGKSESPSLNEKGKNHSSLCWNAVTIVSNKKFHYKIRNYLEKLARTRNKVTDTNSSTFVVLSVSTLHNNPMILSIFGSSSLIRLTSHLELRSNLKSCEVCHSKLLFFAWTPQTHWKWMHW